MADGTTIENNFSQQANQPLNLSLTAVANSSPRGRYTVFWLRPTLQVG